MLRNKMQQFIKGNIANTIRSETRQAEQRKALCKNFVLLALGTGFWQREAIADLWGVSREKCGEKVPGCFPAKQISATLPAVHPRSLPSNTFSVSEATMSDY